jgi:hypothetical protein
MKMPLPMREAGMDVGLEDRRGAALQVEREVAPPLVPQPVREPVRLDGVEALEIEHRHHEAVAGRIAVVIGLDIDAHDRCSTRARRRSWSCRSGG